MTFFRDALRIYLSLQSDFTDNNTKSDDHKKIKKGEQRDGKKKQD